MKTKAVKTIDKTLFIDRNLSDKEAEDLINIILESRKEKGFRE